MKILAQTGHSDIATVYLAETAKGKYIEFVESVQPPIPREKKWVLLISTLYGCPVSCVFCDCGYYYDGKLNKEEILSQIDFLVSKRYPDRKIHVEKFKVQFARNGEPAFNNHVLEVLDILPEIYDAPGLLPSISTIAPANTEDFFEELLIIKKTKYPTRFQMQFSIHTTDEIQRDKIIPVKKWGFQQIADYGEKFFDTGGRKISLNFVLAKEFTIEPDVIKQYFDPDFFLIKITPVNPTYRSKENNITSVINPLQKKYDIVDKLKTCGYDTILSIGELEENQIGSNCGQYILSHLKAEKKIPDGYSYELDYKSNINV